MAEAHREVLLEELKAQVKGVLAKSDCKSFEKPQQVWVSLEEMTVDNNCLTPTFKVRRNFAKKLFAEAIVKMYSKQEDPMIIQMLK